MPHLPDRPPHTLEIASATPLAPLNLICASGFHHGSLDLRWSSPSDLVGNSGFDIHGVNVYRSFDSEFGPWTRLNVAPVGGNFYRDQTSVVLVLQEDVSRSFVAKGTNDPDRRWTFRTAKRPLKLEAAEWIPGVTNANVYVTVNGVPAFVESIDARYGEVQLRNYAYPDPATQKMVPAVLPTSDDDVVLATYKHVAGEVRTALGQRVFYRVTAVGADPATGELLETPLDRAATANNYEFEKLDYIWREAVRRNRFILDQGGERVKLFVQKTAGVRCGCWIATHRQPSKDCPGCHGTGILGGYEGPYDITIAPDDGEKSVQQGNRGRSLNHSYDTWTGPSPIVSQRDFIVKMNGDRYALGPVRSPSNRGMVLQQFFTISHLDEGDSRYRVPMPDPSRLVAPRTRYAVLGGGSSTPMLTEREAIPDERELRGMTVAFENAHRK